MAAPVIVTANKLSLLGLINQAIGEITGLNTLTSVFSNTDPQAVQFLAFAVREGKEFYQMGGRLGGWQALRAENIFTTVSKTVTGNTASGSAVITGMSSTTGLSTSYSINSGTGIAANARIVSVDSGTQVTLDQACTATGTGVTIIFGKDTYSLPNDFSYFQQLTWWDRTYRWQMMGPLTAQEWQVLKSGLSPIGPRRFFRIMGNQFYIHPAPSTTGDTLVFEYYSNAWCQDAFGIAQSTWAADTDYYSLDDDAFILGLKWRWKAAKGLDYAQEKRDYDFSCERLLARDGGNRNLRTNSQAGNVRLLSSDQIPDTGFGT